MKPTQGPAKERKVGLEKQKKWGGEKAKFCFLRMPKLWKVIKFAFGYCTRPVIGFVL